MHFVCNVCGANREDRIVQEGVKTLNMTSLRETIGIRTAIAGTTMCELAALSFVQVVDYKSMMEHTSWTVRHHTWG